MKTVCYLKQGMSLWAKTYKGECGKRRGSSKVTLSLNKITCPKCNELMK